MDSTFNFITYNVKGLQQKNKRIKIFNYLKENLKNGCALLQETHSDNKNEKKWASDWRGKLYQNHGERNSRGVAIGFSENFDFTELRYEQDNCGRLQLLSFKHNDKLFLLINIYNNNTESEQVETLKRLDILLGNFDDVINHTIIMGGDWNFILDADLDASGGNPNSSLKLNSIAEFLKIKQKYDLCDIFRIRNPRKKRFTYFRKTPRISRRLDLFLVSNTAQDVIENCMVLTSLQSDHSPVLVKFNPSRSTLKKGPSYWKFNNSLLGNEIYCNELKQNIDILKNELHDVEPQMKWELFKFKIRHFTSKFSKKIAREKRENQLKWETIVKSFETLPTSEHNHGEREYLEAKDSLENLQNVKTAGYILRSKIKWYEEGEKSTKFFLNLEKKKAIQNTIQTLVVDSQTITDSKAISDSIKIFYKRLFEKRAVTNCNQFLNDLGLPTLNESEKQICERPFSMEDLKLSLDSMENDKSPGNDGLTKEFYSKFWPSICNLLYESLLAAFSKQELSTSQRQAIIKLLEKKDRDRRFIKNWRPISLLNIDVKLLNKTLARALKNVLPSIINSDQTAYVSGRFIGESARVISDILESTQKLNIGGYILTMDIEKAFDSMDHSFLIEVLKTYGFGENFIKWIQIILKNQESCVMNGGSSTGYFKLLRGARQGDPISAYLFVMVLEVFFVMIRNNTGIKGLKICNFEYKLTAFADDTTFFCSDLSSAKCITDTFKIFSIYSGLVVNTDKCEICGIGVKRGEQIALCGMKCINLNTDSIKILGVHYSYNKEIIKTKNFLTVIEDMENVISVWRMRNLTLLGKITILKTLVMSKIVFISFLSEVPKLIIDALTKIQNDFLWDGKRAKVKHTALINSYEQGGLKSLDIGSKIKALQMSWIKRLYDGSSHSWKNIPVFYIRKHSDYIFYPNLEITPKINMPTFYKNIIKFWTEISYCNPVTIDSVLAQRILFNRFIKIGNMAINWNFSNVFFVNDLLDENGYFLNWQNFKAKYNVAETSFFRWRQLMAAIPRDWKILIERDREVRHFNDKQHLLHLTRMLFVERLTCKELYNIMISKMREKPTSEIKIGEIINNPDEIDWSNAYTIARKTTIDSYSRIFHFKLSHNILYLNKILQRMHLADTSLCSFCNVEEETIAHLYSRCTVTINIWSQLRIFFSRNIDLPLLTPQSAFLGFYYINDNKFIINQILLTFKIVIYKAREMGSCNMFRIINKLKQIKIIEDNISQKNERKRLYNHQKWSVIDYIF